MDILAEDERMAIFPTEPAAWDTAERFFLGKTDEEDEIESMQIQLIEFSIPIVDRFYAPPSFKAVYGTSFSMPGSDEVFVV